MLGELFASYDDIFQGIGKLKGVKVTLHIDETVKPVAQKHRRVPFHLRDKVEAKASVEASVEALVFLGFNITMRYISLHFTWRILEHERSRWAKEH